MASSETAILLLPDLPGIEETAKAVLMKQKGVSGIAVHNFDSLPSRNGEGGKQRWYVAVTFNNLKVSQEKLRESLQEHGKLSTEHRKKASVFVLSKNKMMKSGSTTSLMTPRGVPEAAGAANGGSSSSTSKASTCIPENDVHPPVEENTGRPAEQFHLADDEDDSQSESVEKQAGYVDEWHQWMYGNENDSDSEGEQDGGPSHKKPESQATAASYLDEDVGEKQRQQVQIFGPLVGVFGMEGAQKISDQYNNWSLHPYGVETIEQRNKRKEEEEYKKTWWQKLKPWDS